jgi:HSP20 family protein
MIRVDPVRDLASLRDMFDKFFDDTVVRSFGRFTGADRTESCSWMPINMYDTGDSVVVEAALPGVNMTCIDISVLGNTLTIKCDKAYGAEMKGRTYTRREIGDSCYHRQIDLPVAVNVDSAHAYYANGLLTVVLPKSEFARPKPIKIAPAVVSHVKQVVQEAGHRIGIG